MKKNFLLFFFIGCTFIATAQNALLIPPTLSGTNINLTLQHGTVPFFSGPVTNTMGVNGNILGPTLILNQSDVVQFSVNNQLMDTTTIHWHGLHVSSPNDGGPHTFILPNSTWSPSFTIMDKAATYWYHPHLHHHTDMHVSKGIAGMIIVKDNIESALTLPRTYGVDDIPLLIQTKDFDANNQILMHTNNDDVLMVNATLNPFINVPAQVIRYRILNGSSQRTFNLGLTNNKSFYQIASDGGLLNAPVLLTRLQLSPGERAEILIDFSGMNGQNIFLKSFASELPNGIYGATNPGMGAGLSLTGYNPNALNGSDFDIIKFSIAPPNANAITTIPTTLTNNSVYTETSANTTRVLTFTPETMGPNQLNGNFLINGATMDLGVINYSIPLNNIEIWELRNQSAISHPFHIHDVQFFILSRNGTSPPQNEQGRKDVVLVKPQEIVRFITKFDDFANTTVPYMYHCHLLTHEDGGMMGQFIVYDPLSINDDLTEQYGIQIFPNPNFGTFEIRYKEKPDHFLITDILGKAIPFTLDANEKKCSIGQVSPGLYFLQMDFNGKTVSKKIIIQ